MTYVSGGINFMMPESSRLPFALGVPLALGQASVAWALATGQQPAAISEGGGGKGDVNLFLSSLVWLFTGWDSFGNLAEDVADPVHLVKGMLSAAVIALAVYFVCTFGALAAGPGTWQDGYLALAYGRLWEPQLAGTVTSARRTSAAPYPALPYRAQVGTMDLLLRCALQQPYLHIRAGSLSQIRLGTILGFRWKPA